MLVLLTGNTVVAGDGNDTGDYADTKAAVGFPLFGVDVELAYTTTSYDDPAGDVEQLMIHDFLCLFLKHCNKFS